MRWMSLVSKTATIQMRVSDKNAIVLGLRLARQIKNEKIQHKATANSHLNRQIF